MSQKFWQLSARVKRVMKCIPCMELHAYCCMQHTTPHQAVTCVWKNSGGCQQVSQNFLARVGTCLKMFQKVLLANMMHNCSKSGSAHHM